MPESFSGTASLAISKIAEQLVLLAPWLGTGHCVPLSLLRCLLDNLFLRLPASRRMLIARALMLSLSRESTHRLLTSIARMRPQVELPSVPFGNPREEAEGWIAFSDRATLLIYLDVIWHNLPSSARERFFSERICKEWLL